MPGLRRIVVVGSSGSGKTTLAEAIAVARAVPHLELDAVMHADGWNSTPDDEFQRIIDEFTEQEAWVVDGNYTSHGTIEVLWPKADTFVWVDPPKPVVMSRVIRRTLKRMLTREELWNGLREPISNLTRLDPYENIIVWAWTRFDSTRARYEQAMSDGSWDHAEAHRLQSQAETKQFLARCAEFGRP